MTLVWSGSYEEANVIVWSMSESTPAGRIQEYVANLHLKHRVCAVDQGFDLVGNMSYSWGHTKDSHRILYEGYMLVLVL